MGSAALIQDSSPKAHSSPESEAALVEFFGFISRFSEVMNESIVEFCKIFDDLSM